MGKTSEKLKKATIEANNLVKETNCRIESLGQAASGLFGALTMIQQKFDAIRNVPDDKIIQYKEIKKICLNWKSQVDKIYADYESALKASVGKGAAGAGLGVGVAALGPTVAMGIATTFGVASTGTAISALSGAAATNAALAWLGGGALAAGGGGMVAGEAFLAMAGPIGWCIAGVAIVSSVLLILRSRSKKEKMENIFILIAERDQKSYKTAIVELDERIKRVTKETDCLDDAIKKIEIFGTDYTSMSEAQQYELGSYVNLMNSSSQLLVNPIQGLQPKYTDEDLSLFCHAHTDSNSYIKYCEKKFFVSMCNLLYKIKTDDEDRSLLYKKFRKDKKFLEQMGLNKSSLEKRHFDMVDKMLSYKYEKDKR